MENDKELYEYVLRIADNCLILGQRLAEWCGHGPILEQDIAMTNISLDLIGQSRNYYQYAAEIAGEGKNEDDVAFLRDGMEFRNLLLLEQPNGDFAQTVLRQFFFDSFHLPFLKKMVNSKDERLASIAEKSIKEVTYHLRWSEQWVLRLGDGTEESHQRIASALDNLWMYAHESVEMDSLDTKMYDTGIGVNLGEIKDDFTRNIQDTLERATLNVPDSAFVQTGGKEGRHTEHLGYILAEMQHMQRAHPGAKW